MCGVSKGDQSSTMVPFHGSVRIFATPFLICTFLLLTVYHMTTLNKTYRILEYILSRKQFTRELSDFNWEIFEDAYSMGKLDQLQESVALLFPTLVKFITKPHVIPINESCKPPNLVVPRGLTCKHLETPRKVGVLLQFGFDVDALEIHLHELDEVVDKFFLIESIASHSKFVKKKPLIWDSLKDETRFASFRSKIVHFVVDDSNLAKIKEDGDIWDNENQQEKLRWLKFVQWNNATKYFGSNDLLGFGDVDEIPSRNNIYYLKQCELDSDIIDIGIWFPYGDLNTIFKTDQPIQGHPYTLGDPTYWVLQKAEKYVLETGKYPSRMRGRTSEHILGGMHISKFAYPPFHMLKIITATETKLEGIGQLISVGKYYTEFFLPLYGMKWDGDPSRVKSLDGFTEDEVDAIVKIPWFFDCNRKRYPYFEGEHDHRLD